MAAPSSQVPEAVFPALAGGLIRRLTAAIPDFIIAGSFAQHYFFGTPPAKNEIDPMTRVLIGEFLLIHSTLFLAPFLAMLWGPAADVERRSIIAWVVGFGAVYSLFAVLMGNVWLFWMLCGRRAFAIAENQRAFVTGQDKEAPKKFVRRWVTEVACFIGSLTLSVLVLQGRGPGKIAWSTMCVWGFLYFAIMAVITLFDLWLPVNQGNSPTEPPR
ncbi:MAG TPA: hypothetical protein VMT89_16500 [Candidatus Acidoferrales bacterium]|nr:hypothetical protein [Candidatus Acidoferrales bacterium]